MIEIELQRLPHGEGLPLPARATEHAAGLDVVAAEDVGVGAGHVRVPLGSAVGGRAADPAREPLGTFG